MAERVIKHCKSDLDRIHLNPEPHEELMQQGADIAAATIAALVTKTPAKAEENAA